MDVTPIARTAVSDEVLARIVDEILSGRLAPDAFPAERDLAERFGVNRHAIREALKGVRQAGLVHIAQGGKTRVLDWRESAGLDVLSAVAGAGVVPPLRVLRDVTEMRRTIAADAARLCAERATTEQKAAIVALAQGYPDGGYAADAAFWTAVIDGSGNLAYRLALNTLLAGMRGVGEQTFGALGLDGELLDRQAHLDLAVSIADGDAEAAHARTSELLAGIVSALDAAGGLLERLGATVFDLIRAAIPVFVLCLVLEYLSFRFLPDDDELGYDLRDSRTSLTMGIGNVIINLGWKLVVLAALAGAYLLAPVHLPATNPLTWVLLFLADDLAYYWYHRTHHTVRLLWASHVVHHSSRFYNLSTALRQTWTPFTALPYWIPLALLGIPPWMILLQQSVSLLYQFFIHTERVGTLWRPIELVMNTPSHHRVHHGSNAEYLDRNYGGILIVWDRLFGTFEPEGERVRFGLTTNIDTHNPLKVATHEYASNPRQDVRAAESWRDRWGYVVKGPGWSPASARPGACAGG